jgi:hypothetical protein
VKVDLYQNIPDFSLITMALPVCVIIAINKDIRIVTKRVNERADRYIVQERQVSVLVEAGLSG